MYRLAGSRGGAVVWAVDRVRNHHMARQDILPNDKTLSITV